MKKKEINDYITNIKGEIHIETGFGAREDRIHPNDDDVFEIKNVTINGVSKDPDWFLHQVMKHHNKVVRKRKRKRKRNGSN